MCMYPFFFSSQGQFTFEGVHSYLRVTSTSLKKKFKCHNMLYIFIFFIYLCRFSHDYHLLKRLACDIDNIFIDLAEVWFSMLLHIITFLQVYEGPHPMHDLQTHY